MAPCLQSLKMREFLKAESPNIYFFPRSMGLNMFKRVFKRAFFISILVTLSTFSTAYTAELNPSGELAKGLAIERVWMFGKLWAQALESRGRAVNKIFAQKAPGTQAIEYDQNKFTSQQVDQLIQFAKALESLDLPTTASLLSDQGLNDLVSPDHFEDLLVKVLAKSHPDLVSHYGEFQQSVYWKNQFQKKKLLENYLLSKIRSEASFETERKYRPSGPVGIFKSESRLLKPLSLNSQLLLDSEQYISSRMTFLPWAYAWKNGMEIWLSLGNHNDFVRQIDFYQIDLISEVQPNSNNYNKIYFAKLKSTGKPILLVNLISGADRLQQVLSSVEWIAQLSKMSGTAKAIIIGDVSSLHEMTVDHWKTQLKKVGRIDYAIVGQKGTFSSLFQLMAKAQYLQSQNKMAPLEPASPWADLLRREAEIEKGAEELPDTVKKTFLESSLATLAVQSASHDWAVYELKTKQGEKLKLLLVSNGWGDDMKMPVEILNWVRPKELLYVGTAGVFAHSGSDSSNVKVGQLLSPINVEVPGSEMNQSKNYLGNKLIPVQQTSWGQSLSSVVRPLQALAQVRTLFFETQEWLDRKVKQGFEAVEVEVGIIRAQLNPQIPMISVLVVTDRVGDLSATLGDAVPTTKENKLKVIAAFLQGHGLTEVSSKSKSPQVSSNELNLQGSKSTQLEKTFDRLAVILQNLRVRFPQSPLRLVFKKINFGSGPSDLAESVVLLGNKEVQNDPVLSQSGLVVEADGGSSTKGGSVVDSTKDPSYDSSVEVPLSQNADFFNWLWSAWESVAAPKGFGYSISTAGRHVIDQHY